MKFFLKVEIAMKSSLLMDGLKISFKRPFLVLLGVFLWGQAYASKVYIALLPTNTPIYALVTVMEKPCSPSEGNAMYMVGKSASMGCWKLDGQTVRVEWQTGSNAPTAFQFEQFKLVSDDGDSTTASASKQGRVTHLTCAADAWVGDVIVHRDEAGVLKRLQIAGEDVSFAESGTAINFSFQGKNISLSTSTGIFNYETTGFRRILGERNTRGTGTCRQGDPVKKF
jgi:hypothetical protein